jgi:hypothetical protein
MRATTSMMVRATAKGLPSGSLTATRTEPTRAAPSEDPRLETLRDSRRDWSVRVRGRSVCGAVPGQARIAKISYDTGLLDYSAVRPDSAVRLAAASNACSECRSRRKWWESPSEG